jgi:hypothetical protein
MCFEQRSFVALGKTNRRIGYLRPEDRKNSIDEMSKFGPSIVGYMPKTSVRRLYIALVSLSLTIIVIDHFDELMTAPDTKTLMKALSRDALQNKTYKFILGISGVQETIEVLGWGGGDKIRIAGRAGCGRWDSDEIETLARSEPRLMARRAAEQEEIIRLGILSGSPSIFQNMVVTAPNQRRARVGNEQYIDGAERMRTFGWSPT